MLLLGVLFFKSIIDSRCSAQGEDKVSHRKFQQRYDHTNRRSVEGQLNEKE
jgi:hypothetical protein